MVEVRYSFAGVHVAAGAATLLDAREKHGRETGGQQDAADELA